MNAADSAAELPAWNGRRLVFGDLNRYPVMAQALDNEWMPASMLHTAERSRWDLGELDEHEERRAVVRAEFHRALVNSGTLVVNRAFLLNNEAIFRSYLPEAPHADRKAFVKLLRSEALVPFLMDEEHPATRPVFSHDADARLAWGRLLAEHVEPSCVRFSWDAQENSDAVARLFQGFGRGVSGLNWLEPRQLAADLKIKRDEAEAMKRGVLTELALWAIRGEDGPVTRSTVYERFITEPCRSPHERVLRQEPHVVPLKQLIDLQYNALVPVMGGVVAATPPSSPPRSALQELQRGSSDLDAEGLGRILRGVVADALMRAVDGPNSYGALSLDTIVRLRREAEWSAYVDSLEDLTRLDFHTGRLPGSDELMERSRTVATRHAEMLRVARRLAAPDRTLGASARRMVTSLVIESPGEISLVLDPSGHTLQGSAADLAAKGGVLLVRLVFEDVQRRKLGLNNLSHSITLASLRLSDLKKQWTELLGAYGRSVADASAPESGAGTADQQVDLD